MSADLDQQLQQAQQALADAKVAEAERQRIAQEPAARAQVARQQIAALEGQRRAERKQQLLAEHSELLTTAQSAFNAILPALQEAEGRMKAFDLGNLQSAVRGFQAEAASVAQHGNTAYAELQRLGEQPTPGAFRESPDALLLLRQWYDQAAPGSMESLIRAFVLWRLTGRVEFIDMWHMPLIERGRKRLLSRSAR